MSPDPHAILSAEVVLPCPELEATLAFFTERLGFRVESVSPADDPAVVVLAGHGLRLRLERGASGPPVRLRLVCDDPLALGSGATALTAPNGTRIELARTAPPFVLPPLQPSFVLTHLSDGGRWVTGRAGMQYRDLVPGRQGGRFVASHIRIPAGGPVPDYVHYHRVRFQLIYCHRGWVRVVYEDQGPPFVLHAGDCVLQPPEIRHRVLECSSGLEVIELTSPAAHDTCADPELALPTGRTLPERDFAGQRFVRHEAAHAAWRPWRFEGFACRELGIESATGGLAGARVIRPAGARRSPRFGHEAELHFLFVLAGTLALELEKGPSEPLVAGDALVIPARHVHALGACSDDLELLEVTFPARLPDASQAEP